MVANYGHAEVTVDTNARGVPGQVRRQLERAGKTGGESFSNAFDKAANSGLSKTLAGFRESFKKWDDSLKNSDKNMSTLGRRTKAFMKTLGNTEPMIRFRLALGEIGEKLKGLPALMDETTKSGKRQESMWKGLSHNTRQWTLIIGAVIGAMAPLAGLGSAAGSGIFVLAGAFSALLTASVLSFVAFKRFMGDIEKVPAALKPARKAFDDFLKTFSSVMDAMTVEAFKGTEDAWRHFGEVVKALEPGFKRIGTVINNLIQDLSKNLDPSVIEDLNGFLEGSADVMDRVLRMVGRLGRALLDAFNRPSFKRALDNFLGWLDTLIDRFSAFLTGPGFDEWLAHGESVFGALGRLLDTTGRLLNDLVTDETIANLVAFIDNIDKFLQTGGKGILDFATELDIFGVIAKALADFGEALEPLAGPMADFAAAINDVLMTGIDTLAPIIGDIAEALAPFVQNIADFMSANPQLFADILLAIAAGFVAIKAVGIAANITSAISGFVGVAGKKNAGKLAKFATAIAGITLALQGLAEQNKEGGGLEGGGLGVLETIAGGALIGAAFGPLGIAIGALGGAIASMIQDMFLSPEIDGAWKTGWDQLFDPNNFSAAGLGPIKEWFATDFADAISTGWQTAMGAITGGLAGMNEAILGFSASVETAWNDLWTGFSTFVSDTITTILGAITGWLGDMNQGILTFAAEAEANWNTFWQELPKVVGEIAANITGAVSGWWAGIVGMFTSFGATVARIWNSFWSGLVGIVTQIGSSIAGAVSGWWASVSATFTSWISRITGAWNSFWGGLTGAVSSAVSGVLSWVGRLFGPIQNAISAIGNLLGAQGRARAGGGDFASGGILTGPRRILAGEAGPEAIVPLRRSLSMVNPQVRLLSAIAQGKTANAGVPGTGKSLSIAEGAIVIQGVTNPDAAAVGVVNRIAERFAG